MSEMRILPTEAIGRQFIPDAYLPEGNTNDEAVRARNYWVDFDFVKTFGMEIVWGRDLQQPWQLV